MLYPTICPINVIENVPKTEVTSVFNITGFSQVRHNRHYVVFGASPNGKQFPITARHHDEPIVQTGLSF